MRPQPGKHRRRLNDRVLGLITLTVAIALLLGDFTGVLRGAFSGGGRTVHAVFADAQQLQPGDLVRVQGVDVGKVTGISLDPGAQSSTVTMQVDSSAGPLYADASAQLRWRTVLGASYALYLDRGNAAAGPLGSRTIPEGRTSNQVEVEDLAGVDSGAARTGLQTMPGELAKAFSDPVATGQTFGTLAAISPSLTTGVGALRGQNMDSDLRTLVSATASTVRALDTPTTVVRTLVAAAAATLDTTASQQAAIRATIADSPGALQSTDTTVRQLNDTLRLADPLLSSLMPSAPAVAPTVSQLHGTVNGLNLVLNHAVPLLHALRPAVNSLAQASRTGLPLLNGLTPTFDRVNNTVLPYLGAIDPETKHSAAEMIGGTFTGLGSGAPAQEDANGHFIRFPVTLGSSSTYLPCQIYLGNPDAQQLIECQTLQQAMQTFFTWINNEQSSLTARR
jgi:phospholipid/cholesterol/gamma-HCH transport system substrate-binding protein